MTEDEQLNKELTLLLEHAADGREGAVDAFFRRLLESKVFVGLQPMHPAGVDSKMDVPTVGAVSPQDFGFMTVVYDNKECLPVFTEEVFVREWAQRELNVQEKEFKKLLWMLGDDTWMYLNPNQEVGKEITAWEVEQLRQGVEAIPELVAAQEEDPIGGIEVRSGDELYPKLKTKLLPIMEIYPELEEAFLVAVKEEGLESERPMLGVKWGKQANKGKRGYIRSELENVVKDYLGNEHASFVIIDDLGVSGSPNLKLFEDATPFYFAPRQIGNKGFFTSTVDKIRDVFYEESDEETEDNNDE